MHLYYLLNEANLILNLLRAITCKCTKSAFNDDVDLDKVDINKFLSLAQLNGVAAIIFMFFEKSGEIQDKDFNKLTEIYKQNLFNNARQLNELTKLLVLFKKNNLKLVPLKGVLDSEMVFGDLGAYPSGDIDILVPERELTLAEGVILQAGYKESEEFRKGDLLDSHYHLIFQKGNFIIEAHWNLVKRYFSIDPEFWWIGSHTKKYRNIEILQLETEKYILYLIFRLFDHQFAPLKFLVHLSLVISQNQEIEWQKLLRYAELYRMKKLVLFTLQLVKDVLHTNIPDELCTQKQIGYGYLKKLVLKQNFASDIRPHLSMMRFSFFLLSPSLFFRVSTSRLFPSKSEIRLRYGIPSGSLKVYLYKILNPILLFVRKR